MLDPLSDAAFSDLASMDVANEDRKTRVRFYRAPMPDPKATTERGRPMFLSVEMCEIKPDPQTVVCERVDRMQPDPRRRFPGKYAQFKASESQQIEGTLLSSWGLLDAADVAGYTAIDVYTVERLAGLSDADCERRRIDLSHRQRARDFLSMAQGLEPLAQARVENAQLRSEIEILRQTIADLGGKVSAPPAPSAIPAPKRRGRPPKAKPAVAAEPQEH